MNVLVMNMTRLGDLLQSQPTVAGLKAQGHRVGLACLENFAPAAALMQGLDALFPFPGARLLARLDQDWRLALAAYREVTDRVRDEFAPDLVINLTPSEPARLLAMSLGAASTRGFALDDHGFNADTSAWAAFLQLASSSRGASPFNIVDMFRRISGLSGPPGGDGEEGCGFGLRGPDQQTRSEALARLRSELPDGLQGAPPKGYVALQLGASVDRRRWPVARFAQVARGLAAAGYAPVLVGTAEEQALGQRLRAQLNATETDTPVIDLLGATDLPGLAAVLAACRLLITNDTGTMHLAAGLGVPCLAIFLATAQPWDTGPFLPGSICLEPDLACHPCDFGETCAHLEDGCEACRQAIAPQAVLGLALELLEDHDVNIATPRPASGARIWRTVLGADGLLDLVSLSGHEREDRTLLIRLQRDLYRRYLDGDPMPKAATPAGPPCGLSAQAAVPLSSALGTASEFLFLLERQGQLLGRDPLNSVKAKFLATWQRVQSSLCADPRLTLLSALWMFESERPGLDMPEILALTARFRALVDALRWSISIGMDNA
ncbi:MAG: glycosyltransferase family 9 protein [Deltaproteobacteria bacterium HGW-Deltaproteobacteria-8]|nr:MAG: glycosyltransferase family 9 protein [Deltaproteobacteria bacterium HGW-Deltaproteobacteria-8]